MKKLILGLTLAAFALVPAAQAGEQCKDKTAACAAAKTTACAAAKASCQAKKECCSSAKAKSTAQKNGTAKGAHVVKS